MTLPPSQSVDPAAATDEVGPLQIPGTPKPTSEPGLSHTARVGSYEIQGVLGRGGMGTVYRAKVVANCGVPIGETVALKMLSRDNLGQHERRRFEREAAYLQALRHPGIVRILDIGEHKGQPFLVMALINGKSLDELLDYRAHQTGVRQLPFEEVASMVAQGLEALHAAHIAGILHRDLKPGNIMIDKDERVRVLDFGMARRLTGDSKLTASGSVLGTPAYMSPEQATGVNELLSPRSDIYSMGAVCYELVTGRQPFTADNAIGVIKMVLDHPLEPPSTWVNDLPYDLETIILVAMATDPRDRYASAENMAADLRRFVAGQRPLAKRPSSFHGTMRRAYRQRRKYSIIALAAFILLTLLILVGRKLQTHLASQADARVEQATQEFQELLTPVWQDAWTLANPEAWDSLTENAESHALMPDMALVKLTPVAGNVRIAIEFSPLTGAAACEILISQRDIGEGYSLRTEAVAGGWQFQLMRGREGGGGERVAVREHRLDGLRPIDVVFEREDTALRVEVNGRQIIQFIEVAPIEGSEHSDTYIGVRPDTIAIGAIDVDRQRQPERVSHLVAIDLIRQDGRYQRALEMYQTFLADFPDSDERFDAEYRIGLCLAALGQDDKAIKSFASITESQPNESPLAAAAAFQAWTSALRLGDYETANNFFHNIRDRFQLQSLLASVPQDLVKDLPTEIYNRALELAALYPDRALSLLSMSIQVADYLGKHTARALATLTQGDITLAEGKVGTAIEIYQSLADDTTIQRRYRIQARLQVGHGERLRQSSGAAMAAYQDVIDSNDRRWAQWARLWMGDLVLDLGQRDQAIRTWSQSQESKSMPGRIMRHLQVGTEPFRATRDPAFANDVIFFNAILAKLNNQPDAYRDTLQTVVGSSAAHNWPARLAEQMINTWDRDFGEPE